MPRIVEEIMNRELLSVRPDTPTAHVRDLLHTFAIGAVPVLDAWRRPVGVLSVRDLVDGVTVTAGDKMTKPALCIGSESSIREAALRMARTDMHHLVVVDGGGRAVGMLSTLDVLRALVGVPTRHPATFPHWDELTGASWTDDWPLEPQYSAYAPAQPGVLALVRGTMGERDALVWVESSANLRALVEQLVAAPAAQEPELARLLERRDLRFRAAPIVDLAKRERTLSLLLDGITHRPPPGGT